MFKFYIAIAVVVIALICLAIISRNWSCRKGRDEIERTAGPYTVVSVDSGASIVYLRRGERDKERLHETLNLPGVSAPAEGQDGFDESKQCLTAITGGKVTIHEIKSKRLDRFEADDVFGESGQCLQIEQLKAGWVWCKANPTKAYKAAEDEAKAAKRGIWALKAYRDEWMVDAETGDPCPP